MITQINGMTVFLECGGPMFKISVGGKVIEFEMHPYCGPTILKRNGDPLKHQPTPFLEAVSLWAKQGQKMENGLCVWFHEPKEIMKHLGGKNWEIIGYEPAERGS